MINKWTDKIQKGQLAFIFFSAGFFTCTWDLLATLEVYKFTLKAHQGFFLLAFLCALVENLPLKRKDVLARLGSGFSISILGLAGYYILTSPWSAYPLKTILYTGWLVFNLFTIWGTAQLLAAKVDRFSFLKLALFTMAFHTVIVLFDQVAYQFGHVGGFIGFNQDLYLDWGVSRPHAFASEPSYLGTFLCLGVLTTLPWILFQKRWSLSLLWIACVFALVFTNSRTAWFGLLAGIFLFGLLYRRFVGRISRKIYLALVILPVVFAGVFFAITTPGHRLVLKERLVVSMVNGQDGPSNARIRALATAWDMAKRTNGKGTGLGASFKYWMDHYLRTDIEFTLPQWTLDQRYFKKNTFGDEVIMSIWGQTLAEGGIPGILLFFSAAFFFLRSQWRRFRESNDLLVLGSLVASLVFFFFVTLWLGNIARGDIWVWYALWSRLALPNPA